MILKKRNLIVILLILLTSVYSGCLNNSNSFTVDINGYADFSSIRDAINKSLDGYTIYVHSGIYHESISLIKSINIIGSDPKTTMITGKEKKYGVDIVNINANNCSFSGFTITNSFNSPSLTGIKISSNDNKIEDNIIIGAQVGIYIANGGINNMISGNVISNNTDGISIFSAHNNYISDNVISNNSDSGIRMKDARLNVFKRNIIMSNEKGIYLCCEAIGNLFYNNIFENNYEMNVKGSATNSWSNGSIGNYWDGYSNSDSDNDGIWDEPYPIEADITQDDYPVVNRPEIYNNIY